MLVVLAGKSCFPLVLWNTGHCCLFLMCMFDRSERQGVLYWLGFGDFPDDLMTYTTLIEVNLACQTSHHPLTFGLENLGFLDTCIHALQSYSPEFLFLNPCHCFQWLNYCKGFVCFCCVSLWSSLWSVRQRRPDWDIILFWDLAIRSKFSARWRSTINTIQVLSVSPSMLETLCMDGLYL